MLNIKQIPITCLFSAALIATVNSGCAGNGKIEKIQSFDTGWRFNAGEINDAEKPVGQGPQFIAKGILHQAVEEHGINGSPRAVRRQNTVPITEPGHKITAFGTFDLDSIQRLNELARRKRFQVALQTPAISL